MGVEPVSKSDRNRDAFVPLHGCRIRSSILACAVALLFLSLPAHAQQYSLVGVVRDAATRAPLQFATIRIAETGGGTTTDRNGAFMLSLERGRYTLVVSYIGYAGLKKTIEVSGTSQTLDLEMLQGRIELPGVTVTPGDNPALEIIRQAIAYRERRLERLRNYRHSAHTKMAVKIFNPDTSFGYVDSSSSTAADGSRTKVVRSRRRSRSDSVFTVLLETQTDAWWARPDRKKEIVTARKQSAMLPKELNMLVSSTFIEDFSKDRIILEERAPITGPISSAGLEAYDYTLRGTTSIDGEPAFIIDIRPGSKIDPLLEGTLYISDGSYALAMVDVHFNEAALPPFVRSLRFRQHFQLVDREFWLPADVIFDAGIELSFLVTIKLKIEGMTVMQDYAVNRDSNETVFDRTAIKVLKEADERDSAYWVLHQKIPNTPEEVEDYHLADSVKIRMDSVRNRYTVTSFFMGQQFAVGDTRIQVPGLFGVYRFNRVQGSVVALPLQALRPLPWIESADAEAGYGFSDRRPTYHLRGEFEPFSTRDIGFGASFFDDVFHISDGDDLFDKGATTLSNLLYKFDYQDYFRKRGTEVRFHADVFRLFPVSVTAGRNSYASAEKRSDWSIFRRDEPYRDNPRINDGVITRVSARIGFDGREFIDNAGMIMRIGDRSFVPEFGMQRLFCDIGGKRFTTDLFSASIEGHAGLGMFGITAYRANWSMAEGMLPTQELLLLPGSVDGITSRWRFRTLRPREIGGDRMATVHVQQDLGEVFRRFHVPLLQSSGIGLLLFANAGWAAMRDDTRAMQTVEVGTTATPFYEAGFGFDRIFLFMRFDFAWRMNHFRDGRNFYLGLSSAFQL